MQEPGGTDFMDEIFTGIMQAYIPYMERLGNGSLCFLSVF